MPVILLIIKRTNYLVEFQFVVSTNKIIEFIFKSNCDSKTSTSHLILRREGDSNPRSRSRNTRFPGVPVKPLLHLSLLHFRHPGNKRFANYKKNVKIGTAIH